MPDFVRSAVLRLVVSRFPDFVYSSPGSEPLIYIERGHADEPVEVLQYRALDVVPLIDTFILWRHLVPGQLPTALACATENDLVEAVTLEVDALLSEYWSSREAHEAVGDVFICHASEDKDEFAAPLARALRSRGVPVWYDEFSVDWGDSLREKIDAGVAACRFGIVILSESFFAKRWTRYELDGLAGREMQFGRKVILPIWHGVDHDRVARSSPSLAERAALSSTLGIDAIAERLTSMLGRSVPSLSSAADIDVDWHDRTDLLDPPRLLVPRLDVLEQLLEAASSHSSGGDEAIAQDLRAEARRLLDALIERAEAGGIVATVPPSDFPSSKLPPGFVDGMFGGARVPARYAEMTEQEIVNMCQSSESGTQLLDVWLHELQGNRRSGVLSAVRDRIASERSRRQGR